jgi:hypothetical protein
MVRVAAGLILEADWRMFCEVVAVGLGDKAEIHYTRYIGIFENT